LKQHIALDTDRWRKLIKATGMKIKAD